MLNFNDIWTQNIKKKKKKSIFFQKYYSMQSEQIRSHELLLVEHFVSVWTNGKEHVLCGDITELFPDKPDHPEQQPHHLLYQWPEGQARGGHLPQLLLGELQEADQS